MKWRLSLALQIFIFGYKINALCYMKIIMLIIISFFGSISIVLKPLWCLMLNGKSWTFTTCHFRCPSSEGHLRYNIDKDHADLLHVGAVEASVSHVACNRPWFKRKCSNHFAIEVAIGKVHYSHC